MALLIRMPEVAANATHAVLATWVRQSGDEVAAGECIAEIETDKAMVELSAERAGRLGEVLVEAGCEIPVGAPVAVLLEPGEEAADAQALLAVDAGTASPNAAASEAERGAEPDATAAPQAGESRDPDPGQHLFASPRARRLAADTGVKLAGIVGSGPHGRIVQRDVESARGGPTKVDVAAPQIQAPSHGGEDCILTPFTPMRRTIAARLTESKSTVPHFYLSARCRVDRLLALRKQIVAQTAHKPSINDFVVRAAALALREVPAANVSWTPDGVRHHRHADVAIAVSADGGLLTPVLREADARPLAALGRALAELAERARAGRLLPAEYQGGSMTVSNLGMYGVVSFSAILNPPQALILAVGAAHPAPVVEDDRVVAGSLMEVTLSVDHRVIDGAVAAQWLAAFKGFIEAPLTLLL